jgi:hypothetical protein
MKKSGNNKSKWRIIRTIVLLPVISLIWMIGWTLYCVGDQRVSQSAQNENIETFQTGASERKELKEVRQVLA